MDILVQIANIRSQCRAEMPASSLLESTEQENKREKEKHGNKQTQTLNGGGYKQTSEYFHMTPIPVALQVNCIQHLMKCCDLGMIKIMSRNVTDQAIAY